MTSEELERKITQQQTLLTMYEENLSLEDDPRRRLKLQENVEEIKVLILGYQTKLAQMRPAAPPRPVVAHQTHSHFLANAPYGLDAELVGRRQELFLLDDWYQHDRNHPFLAVIGLGGTGKSALTWAWLQTLMANGQAPPLVVWWSFYESDGTMDRLLDTVLAYFGNDPHQFPSLRAKVERFVIQLQHHPVLLILDGAERLLRAYGSMGAAYQADEVAEGGVGAGMRQCIDPVTAHLLHWLAQPGLTRAQTVMSSRMLPDELTGRGKGLLVGVRRHDLTGLSLADAAQLFREAGIQASLAEVRAVAEPVGYHSLSLRLLANTAARDPHTPNDLRAAAHYDPTTDLLGKRQHILTRAYDSLPPTAQDLLSRLAAFRISVAWPVVVAVMGDTPEVRSDLRRLEERSLLQCTRAPNQPAQYDLHPIVRRYAYDHLRNAAETHAQLVNYFEAVPPKEKVQTLADLHPAIELYHHLTRAGRYDEAFVLFRDDLATPLFYQLGTYQTQIELLRALFPAGESQPPRLQQEDGRAWTLSALGNSYSFAGQPAAAVPLYEQANAIAEKQGNKKSLSHGLCNLADEQSMIGAFRAAATNLRHLVALGQEIEERFVEAIGHCEYGRLLALYGDEATSAAELGTALAQFTAEREFQAQGIVWIHRAYAALLRGEAGAAQEAAREALRLADEKARTHHPNERDYIRVHWLLGWAALAKGELATAHTHLDETLRRCRAINIVYHEPAILLATARLARAEARLGDAEELAEEARLIAERAGYKLDLADIHNLLAQLALDTGDRLASRTHAQRAHDYAYCDGPPYAYQSALDEAQRLLALSQ